MKDTAKPPTVLAAIAAAHRTDPDHAVVYEKRLGRWVARTRDDLVSLVTRVALGLGNLDFSPGSVAAILFGSHLSWLGADLGVQAAGGRAVALAPHAVDEAAHVLADCGVSVAFVEGYEQADVLLGLVDEGRLPSLRRIIYLHAAGVGVYDSELLMPFDELVAGAELSDVAEEFGRLVDIVEPGDPAIINYTSGTTGPAKGSVLTHTAIVAGATAVTAALDLGPRDRVLAYLPMGHPIERGATIYPALLSGALLALPESENTADQALAEVLPTYVHLPPRQVKTMVALIAVRLGESRGFKGLIAKRWLRKAAAAAGQARGPKAPGPLSRFLVGFPIREKMGLHKVRWALVSGRTVPHRVREYYSFLGLNLRSAYSLAEAGGFVAASLEDSPRYEATGTPLSGVEIQIGSNDEIEVRGPMIAAGYHGAAGIDRSALDDEGWFRTGDVGRMEDGQIVVFGRAGVTAPGPGGTTVLAEHVESVLRANEYIKDAVVAVQDDRTVAVIELEFATVSRWAAHYGIGYSTNASLAALPQVRKLIERRITRAAESAGLSPPSEVRLLSFSLDGLPGALAAGGTVRRDVVLSLSEPATNT